MRWFRSNKDAATEPVERARRCDMSVYSRHESIQAVTVDLTSRRRPRPGTSATGLAGPPGWAGKAPPSVQRRRRRVRYWNRSSRSFLVVAAGIITVLRRRRRVETSPETRPGDPLLRKSVGRTNDHRPSVPLASNQAGQPPLSDRDTERW